MTMKRLPSGLALALLMLSGCAKKPAQPPPAPPPPAPAPPAPKQNLVVLLPDPSGKAGRVVITNSAGTQTLSEPYQATRVERSDAAPGAPFAMDPAEVRRVFGATLDTLPQAEAVFVLYFDEGKDTLNAQSQAQLQSILNAIRDRHSTEITVIGHTDTTADPQHNYQLGLRRAKAVAAVLLGRGVKNANLFVDSHGDTDLAVKTGRGVAEGRNRRVEVTVR